MAALTVGSDISAVAQAATEALKALEQLEAAENTPDMLAAGKAEILRKMRAQIAAAVATNNLQEQQEIGA